MRLSMSRSKYWFMALAEPDAMNNPSRTRMKRTGWSTKLPSITSAVAPVMMTSKLIVGLVSLRNAGSFDAKADLPSTGCFGARHRQRRVVTRLEGEHDEHQEQDQSGTMMGDGQPIGHA